MFTEYSENEIGSYCPICGKELKSMGSVYNSLTLKGKSRIKTFITECPNKHLVFVKTTSIPEKDNHVFVKTYYMLDQDIKDHYCVY
jgi:hypothetical protein